MKSSSSFRCIKVGNSSPCCVCYSKPSQTRQEVLKLSLSPNLYSTLCCFGILSKNRYHVVIDTVSRKEGFSPGMNTQSTETDKPLKSWTSGRWDVWRWISYPHSYHNIGIPVRRNVYLAEYFSLKVFTWFQCIISNMFDSFHTFPSTYIIVFRDTLSFSVVCQGKKTMLQV